MSNKNEMSTEHILAMMKSHFGNAAKSYWVYADELCPCCQIQKIDEFFVKGVRSISINGFMYREKGVLIGYFLCGECAKKIHALTVYKKSPLHVAIEENLVKAYDCYLASLDA